MESELSVQYYLNVVLRQWKVVVVVFVVATLAAAGASLVQQPSYGATVTLMEQTYELYDLPRLASLDRTAVKLYPALATAAAVEDSVIEAIGSSLSPTEMTPGALVSTVTVREDKDNPALFRISVVSNSPEKAILVANTWAEKYIEEANSFQLAWDPELEAVEQNLEGAEAALTAFREETGLGMVEEVSGDQLFAVLGPSGVRLSKKVELLAVHQQARDSLSLLMQSALLLKDTGGSIDDLPLQLLSSRAISERGYLSAELVKAQQSLDEVIKLLGSENEIMSAVIGQLRAEVEALQEELAQDQLELERLIRERDLAAGAYKALKDQIQEEALFQINTYIVSGATRARPLGPDPKLNIILGAALGPVAGVGGALAAAPSV
jgi:uncharacterized protein involved in exopolysaccharide biosynthesis